MVESPRRYRAGCMRGRAPINDQPCANTMNGDLVCVPWYGVRGACQMQSPSTRYVRRNVISSLTNRTCTDDICCMAFLSTMTYWLKSASRMSLGVPRVAQYSTGITGRPNSVAYGFSDRPPGGK